MEYIVLFIILVATFLAMSNYIKRGIQGRWKEAVDDLGDQYDPRFTDSDIRHRINSTIETSIITVEGALPSGVNGFWTHRTDASRTVETKTGTLEVGGF